MLTPSLGCRRIFLFFGLLILSSALRAQVASTNAFVEFAGSASNLTNTPFWIRANQAGTVPLTGPFASLRVGHSKSYTYPWKVGRNSNIRKHFDARYGIELVTNSTFSGGMPKLDVLIPEAFAAVRRRGIELQVGRRREVIGLADSTIGMGPLAGANNALPIPKIQLSIPEFLPIGFLKDVVAIKGQYAHGWFTNTGPVKNYYLHQKSFYGRFGKPKWPVKLYGGFLHLVQWGGRSDKFLPGNSSVKNGKLPSSPKQYIDMVTGASLAARTNVDTSIISLNDAGNRIGNHLGTIDLGVEVITGSFSLLAYRQSYFEDGSLFYLTNIADGLNGVRFRNLTKDRKWGIRIQDIVAEFLYTKSQGGAEFGTDNKKRGADNYFNHTQYIDGWSYAGRGIGTPFITPYREALPTLPRQLITTMAPTYYSFFNNNRVRALHLGMTGNVSSYSFMLKLSYSQNYGAYVSPFPKAVNQFSSLLQVSFPVIPSQQLKASVAVASDYGDLLAKSTGIFLSIRKSWGTANPRPQALLPREELPEREEYDEQ